MFLDTELIELKSNSTNKDLFDEGISVKGIDWHIDHSYRVIVEVCKLLIRSNPDDYKRDFNLSRSVIFMTNVIPRGKGRSPKHVVAVDEITDKSLSELHEKSLKTISEISNLPAHSFFKHPVFGNLDLEMSKQFIKIHTIHHLKIIREISKNKTQ